MKKIPPKTDTDFRIAFAQSWNLAVALIAPVVPRLTEPTNEKEVRERNKALKDTMEDWQKYFYDKLVTEPLKEDMIKQTNGDKSDKIAKHRIDYIEDLEQPE